MQEQVYTTQLPLESPSRPGYSDSTHVTEICVESSTRMGESTSGVRLSFTSKLEYQPFSGFYPGQGIALQTPGLVGWLGGHLTTGISRGAR